MRKTMLLLVIVLLCGILSTGYVLAEPQYLTCPDSPDGLHHMHVNCAGGKVVNEETGDIVINGVHYVCEYCNEPLITLNFHTTGWLGYYITAGEMTKDTDMPVGDFLIARYLTHYTDITQLKYTMEPRLDGYVFHNL